jgi:type III pantothenate kinase
MADAMRAVLRDPEETARMGRAARERVERVFQWDRAASQMVDVFEEVIHAADRRSRAA